MEGKRLQTMMPLTITFDDIADDCFGPWSFVQSSILCPASCIFRAHARRHCSLRARATALFPNSLVDITHKIRARFLQNLLEELLQFVFEYVPE